MEILTRMTNLEIRLNRLAPDVGVATDRFQLLVYFHLVKSMYYFPLVVLNENLSLLDVFFSRGLKQMEV